MYGSGGMVKPSSNELGTNQNGPELFFGLVGAVGTNLTPVIDTLKKQLAEVDYEPVLIRLSELLLKLKRNSHLKFLHDGPEDERIDKFMDAGNEARRHLERGDAMALLAMRDIRRYRENAHGDELKPVPRTAYILNSLKHPDEIETLRNIYGDNFFVFATYQHSRARVERLRHRIEKREGQELQSEYQNLRRTNIARKLSILQNATRKRSELNLVKMFEVHFR